MIREGVVVVFIITGKARSRELRENRARGKLFDVHDGVTNEEDNIHVFIELDIMQRSSIIERRVIKANRPAVQSFL